LYFHFSDLWLSCIKRHIDDLLGGGGMRGIGFCGLAVSLAGLALAGCGANFNSIYRHQEIGTTAPSLTMVDAKQRVILTAPVKTGGGSAIVGRVRFCAEASPDVFSVLAQAASGTGSLGKTADPKAIQAAASLAYSSSETGATIARTQAVNLLRESMYRTCERYLNGDISDLEMTVQNVRDQRAMISALAVEQITNAARPRVVVLRNSGTAASGSSSGEATVRIDDAYKALQTAGAAITDKQKAVDKLEEATPTCKAIKTKVDAGTALEAAETTRKSDCDKATAALKTATDDRDAKLAHYKALQTAATQAGGGPASAGTTTASEMSAEVGQAATAGDLAAVAKTVQAIVLANFEQDEFLMLCLKVLPKNDPPRLAETCASYINAGIKQQEAQVAANTARLMAEKAQFDTEVKMTTESVARAQATAFDRFWAKAAQAGASDTANPTELAKVVDAYLKANPDTSSKPELQSLRRAKTRVQAAAAFGKLQTRIQEDLGN
jgi:hypothetical protein